MRSLAIHRTAQICDLGLLKAQPKMGSDAPNDHPIHTLQSAYGTQNVYMCHYRHIFTFLSCKFMLLMHREIMYLGWKHVQSTRPPVLNQCFQDGNVVA